MRERLPQLGRELWFPDPRRAQRGAMAGLVAIGGDLSVPRLLLAYRSGIFPWSVDPITWWSPDPRAIFDLPSFRPPRSLARLLRRGAFTVTVNRAFRAVIEGCARPEHPRQQWLTPPMIAAYVQLHEAGHAHSLECWAGGELAGGIYGVAVGGLFAGESMFYRVSNASKVALCHLIERLRARGYALFDIQMVTPITGQLGAREISRLDYLARLKRAVDLPCHFSD